MLLSWLILGLLLVVRYHRIFCVFVFSVVVFGHEASACYLEVGPVKGTDTAHKASFRYLRSGENIGNAK